MTIARDRTATRVLVGRIVVVIFWLIPFATPAAIRLLGDARHVRRRIQRGLASALGRPSPIGRGPTWRAAKASLLVFWLVQTLVAVCKCRDERQPR